MTSKAGLVDFPQVRKGFVLWAFAALMSGQTPQIAEVPSFFLLPQVHLTTAITSSVSDLLVGRLLAAPMPAISATPIPVPRPNRLRKGQYLGRFRVTFYWLVEEASYPGKRTVPLYTTNGKLIGNFNPQFVKDFRVESCALLEDGRIISYMKRANRCVVVDAPVGINGFTLCDLKSVAVDQNVINVGSTLYIPDAEGVQLGDGRLHNGIFRAHDIGSAIKGNRLDVYLGLKSNMDCFRSTSLCRPGEVDVYVLQ